MLTDRKQVRLDEGHRLAAEAHTAILALPHNLSTFETMKAEVRLIEIALHRYARWLAHQEMIEAAEAVFNNSVTHETPIYSPLDSVDTPSPSDDDQ